MNLRRPMVHSFLAVILLATLNSYAFAQMRCESVLTAEARIVRTHMTIGDEFGRRLNDYNVEMIERIVNNLQDYTLAERMQFIESLQYLNYSDPHLTKEVETVLERHLTNEEAIALRFARALGRREQGVRNEEGLLAFSGNYSKEQIARKDRVLELVGFSIEERAQIMTTKLIEEDLTRYTIDNFEWDADAQTTQQAQAMNKEVLRQMQAASLEASSSNRARAMNYKEGVALYESVTRNPVARLLHIRKYDPDGGIGFCFGRAMVTHLEALSRGLQKDSIRKVFFAGKLKSLSKEIVWGFHVATAVKSSEGGWWVIDPLQGRLLTFEEWYQRMSAHDLVGNGRLYVAEASRFGGMGNARYSKEELVSDFYNNYFNDVMNYYKLKSKNQEPKKSVFVKAFDWFLAVIRLGI